jgi:hypothetical protein
LYFRSPVNLASGMSLAGSSTVESFDKLFTLPT